MTMICEECREETTALCNDLCPPCWNIAQEAWEKKMAIRQDATQFDPQKLVNMLLTQHWMHECKITPDYMPPFPREDTVPTCQVHYHYPDGTRSGLRHSGGPMQGYFWDIYADDMHSPELALYAIIHAPAPSRVGTVVNTHGR